VSLDQTGIYQLASRVAWSTNIIVSALNAAWLPIFFRDADKPDAPEAFGRIYYYYCIAIGALATAIAVCSREIVELIATPEYAESAAVVPPLMAAVFLRALYSFTTTQGITRSGRTHLLTLIAFLAAGVQILLNFLLVPRWEVGGAVISIAASFGVLLFVSHHFAQQGFPAKWQYQRVARFVVLSVGTFAVSQLIPGVALPLALALKLLLLLAATVAAVPLGVVSDREITRIKDAMVDWRRGLLARYT